MGEQQLSFLPEQKPVQTDVVRPGDTLVVTPQHPLTREVGGMLMERLTALGIQFVILGPNYTVVSEPFSSEAVDRG